jgi:hypothetical protein
MLLKTTHVLNFVIDEILSKQKLQTGVSGNE